MLEKIKGAKENSLDKKFNQIVNDLETNVDSRIKFVGLGLVTLSVALFM